MKRITSVLFLASALLSAQQKPVNAKPEVPVTVSLSTDQELYFRRLQAKYDRATLQYQQVQAAIEKQVLSNPGFQQAKAAAEDAQAELTKAAQNLVKQTCGEGGKLQEEDSKLVCHSAPTSKAVTTSK